MANRRIIYNDEVIATLSSLIGLFNKQLAVAERPGIRSHILFGNMVGVTKFVAVRFTAIQNHWWNYSFGTYMLGPHCVIRN